MSKAIGYMELVGLDIARLALSRLYDRPIEMIRIIHFCVDNTQLEEDMKKSALSEYFKERSPELAAEHRVPITTLFDHMRRLTFKKGLVLIGKGTSKRSAKKFSFSAVFPNFMTGLSAPPNVLIEIESEGRVMVGIVRLSVRTQEQGTSLYGVFEVDEGATQIAQCAINSANRSSVGK